MKFLLALLSFLSLSCTHTDSKYLPNPYNFPQNFYVDQDLTIRSLRDSKELKAQVQRKGSVVTLVLTDPQTSMILLKLELAREKEPKFLFQAPILEKTGFAAVKIARAIQFLYESNDIPLRSSEYRVRGPANTFTYSWEALKDAGDCQFPAEMELKFEREAFDVLIETKSLDCGI